MSKALDPKDTCVLVTGGAGFIGSHLLLLCIFLSLDLMVYHT